jgi:hypothetical protein
MKVKFVWLTFAVMLVSVLISLRGYPQASDKPSSTPLANVIASRDTDQTLKLLMTYVQRPHFPIKFAADVGEYQVVYSTEDGATERIPIKFCPWTGTPLPKSKRPESFEEITGDEFNRLRTLLDAASTLDQARLILGKPDAELATTGSSPRRLIYTRLSATADVVLQQSGPEGVEVIVQPKEKKR